MSRIMTGLVVCGLALAGPAAHASTPAGAWEIHSLGTLGGDFSLAVDLNNAGQVVGDALTGPIVIFPTDPPFSLQRAFISAPDGGPLTEIAITTGGFVSHATAVNEAGQVVGTTTEGSSFPIAFVAGPNGVDMVQSRQSSQPADINNVGQTIFNDSDFRTPAAFLAHNDGNSGVVQITTPDDTPEQPAVAVALNDQGQVAVNGATFGYLWTAAEGARNLTPDAFASRVVDINQAGQVLGVLVNDALAEQVFLTAPNGGPLTLVGAPNSDNDPTGLNLFGQIVGTASFAGEIQGYVSGPGGQGFTVLDTLAAVVAGGWTDLSPVAINDVGQIAGTGFIDGKQRAFLLTPIPEPEAYALMLAGLGLLAARRRRQAAAIAGPSARPAHARAHAR